MKHSLKRLSGIALSALLTLQSLSAPARAEVKGALMPTVDEAYYATVDYYGNLLRGSVVKTWSLNGAGEITDYGTYSAVTNLTDRTEAEQSGDSTVFRFGEKPPAQFYYEGETEEPFYALPWSITVTYRLNGVPVKAEELGGKQGEVEISLYAKPNPAASEYARNNYILTAAAVLNMNDFLSVEAPDAQIQTVGNLKTAAFLWLPGEEETFLLRLGADSFEMSGITFLMGPLNSGRLSKITDLRDMKEDMEDSWDDLNDAADEILDSVDSMKSGLDRAADGLQELDTVRADVRKHHSAFYGDLDRFLGDLSGLSDTLKPMSGHLSAANNTVTDLRDNLTALNDTLLSVRTDLDDTASVLRSLRNDMVHVQDVTGDLDSETHHVRNDIDSLQRLNRKGKDSIGGSINGTLSQMTQLYQAYAAYMKAHGLEPLDAIGDGKLLYDLEGDGTIGLGSASNAGRAVSYEAGGIFDISGASYPEGSFQEFAIEKLTDLGYDDEEIGFAIGLWNYREDVQKAGKSANAVYSEMDDLLEDLLDVDLSQLFDLAFELSGDLEQGFEIGEDLVKKADRGIEDLDRLHATIDDYLPKLQEALSDATLTADALQGSIGSLAAFLSTTRNIMKENSDRLNDGTERVLTGTADLLRKSSGAVDSTKKLRDAKDSIRTLVDDKWDEYTGDKNNLFRMDADAAPESLTSGKNRSVTSVSVLIRTQEIELPEEDDAEDADSTGTRDEAPTTILGRVGKMFTDLWHFLTGWTHRS